jgi:uncharacterized protein (DUF305 family)
MMKFFLLTMLFFSPPVLAMTTEADHSMMNHSDIPMPVMMNEASIPTSNTMRVDMKATIMVPSTEAYRHINHTMHEAMNIEFTGNPDIDFLRGMIPHHQGALDMAAVQKQYGQDGTVKFFTNKVQRDQTKEIRWMRILLQTLEYEQDATQPINEAAIEAFKTGNHAMHHNMETPYTDNADIDFMTGMIPHHEGAVVMSKIVLEHGEDKRVKDLATAIINAQVSEITTMKKWLSRLKWRPHLWRA